MERECRTRAHVNLALMNALKEQFGSRIRFHWLEHDRDNRTEVFLAPENPAEFPKVIGYIVPRPAPVYAEYQAESAEYEWRDDDGG